MMARAGTDSVKGLDARSTYSIKVCVDNLEFQAAHITPVNSVPTLHGHSFKLTLCVSGELTSEGWVMDFLRLREVVQNIVKRYNYSLLVSEDIAKDLRISGRSAVKLGILTNLPTAENLALKICRDSIAALHRVVKGLKHVEVRLWEGSDFHVEVMCGLDSNT